MTALDAKLTTFDRHAEAAVDFLIRWLENDRAALIALAKGRHVEGHYRYADKLMYEYSDDELVAEASQELADGINYIGRMLSRQAPVHRLGGPSAAESERPVA